MSLSAGAFPTRLAGRRCERAAGFGGAENGAISGAGMVAGMGFIGGTAATAMGWLRAS